MKERLGTTYVDRCTALVTGDWEVVASTMASSFYTTTMNGIRVSKGTYIGLVRKGFRDGAKVISCTVRLANFSGKGTSLSVRSRIAVTVSKLTPTTEIQVTSDTISSDVWVIIGSRLLETSSHEIYAKNTPIRILPR